ncbi:MAG: hypothetical protein K0R73_611 [Candidatus Midichloriaceae bacterium]|jgi:hypothetical protein|nr:hypothetical protein [Candidatus Midichloriaceae bacterium]
MAIVKVSSKNNKNEILEAYNALLEEVEGLNDNDRAKAQKREAEKEIVAVAQSNTKSDIIHQIADLKVGISNSLDELSKKLLVERDKLANLQEASNIAARGLEETHNIVANANSLEVLILANRRKQQEFEALKIENQNALQKEMLEKKEIWAKEQKEYELRKKEQEELYKKEIKRQEEEYDYQRKLKEQKDADQYEVNKVNLERELEEKRQKVEKELSEREAVLSSKELELTELREASQNFTKTLEEKIAEATAKVSADLEMRYKYTNELKAKEIEGQISLYKQTIESLDDKLKEKQTIINELTKQLTSAQIQAQELAKKVIEGAATGIRQLREPNDTRDDKK